MRAALHSLVDRLKARVGGSLDGRYANFAGATQACVGQGYEANDVVEVVARKTVRLRTAIGAAADDTNVSPSEARIYLAIACAAAGNNIVSILDFGGACGAHLLRARAFFGDRLQLRWAIVETPEMIRAAKTHHLDDGTNYFADLASARAAIGTPDLLLCSGALQYVPDSFGTLESLLDVGARNFCLTRTPIAEGKGGFYCLQRTRLSSNGPGALPDGFADRWLCYPMAIIDRHRLDERLRKAPLRWDIIAEEGLLHHSEAGFIRFVTYFGRM